MPDDQPETALARCARRLGYVLMERDALRERNAELLRQLHALQDVYIATLAELDGLRGKQGGTSVT